MSEMTDLSTKLRTEGARLADFMSQLTEQDWQREVYTEGAVWTVRNIFSHLVTSERAFIKLFVNIRAGGPGVSEDFVIDRYNASQQRKTRDMDPQQLLAAYHLARDEMTALVAGLTETELALRGRHPFLGSTSLREMVKMIYIHNQTHYRDIRRALRAGGASE